MFTFLEDLRKLVYIADPQSYDLIYLNKAGREQFGVEEVRGRKCYELLQGRQAPCPFCTNAKLSFDSIYEWETFNPLTKRYYLLKDKLIEHEGKPARLEMAFDVTDKTQQNMALKHALDAEAIVLRCVELLHAGGELSAAIDGVLRQFGRFLHADRTYIFQIEGTRMDNTHEWCAPGIVPAKDMLQDLDVALVGRWQESFAKKRGMILADIEDIRESHPDEYETLKMQNIQRLVTVPIFTEDTLTGYLGADNPPFERIQHIEALLLTLARFLALRLQNFRLSHHDMLTGAYNRTAFMEETARIEKQPDAFGSIGVIYLDVNGLKEENDRYGHAAGDALLKKTARGLRESFGRDAVYRLGGDEFVVLQKNVAADAFKSGLEAYREKLAAQETPSVSMGYSWAPEAAGIRRLLSETDEAMYADKRRHYRSRAIHARYRYAFDETMLLSTESSLRRMIAEKRIEVYFQPRFDIKTLAHTGAEALVRFHPEGGAALPAEEFLAMLERNCLISILDLYVFEEVLAQLQRWRAHGAAPLPVAVNLSRYSLMDAGFIDQMEAVQARYGLPRSLLLIELTDSRVVHSFPLDDKLAALASLGYSLGIEGFGASDSNLSLFTRARYDTLSVDRSILRDLAGDGAGFELVASLCGACARSGVRVAAKGVETQAQLETMRRAGCTITQGCLFDAALPGEDYYEKYLRQPR